MKHTPAPWTIQEYGDDDTPTLVVRKGDTENRICFMATPGSHGDPAMIEADAHLIAAAPDLLKAAQRALNVLRAQGESIRPNNVLGALNAAIEKATAYKRP